MGTGKLLNLTVPSTSLNLFTVSFLLRDTKSDPNVSLMAGEDEFGFSLAHKTHQIRHTLPHGRTTSGELLLRHICKLYRHPTTYP